MVQRPLRVGCALGTATGNRSSAVSRSRIRVLVAEDDPDILAVIALALGRVGGMEVTYCADGLAVLKQVPTVAPELILLDVMMPELDGLETLTRLRADPRTAAIPVVFLTARVQPSDLAAYRAKGALAVIGKPFDPMTLAQQLRELHADSLRPR